MPTVRPLGVKLIATYLCMKALALITAVYIVQTRPDLRPGATDFISINSLRIGDSGTYISAIINLSVGLGISFQQRWARTVTVIINTYYFCRMAFVSVILVGFDRKSLISQTSSPYFMISSVASLLILCYLLDPGVKRAFGDRS